MPTAILTDPDIKLTALKVYGVLASHKNPKNQTWCSLGRLVDMFNEEIAKPNICRALKQLCDRGYIYKLSPGGGRALGSKNWGRSTLYYIVPPERIGKHVKPPKEPENVISGDNKNPETEAPFFDQNIISGDTKTLSQEIPKEHLGIFNTPTVETVVKKTADKLAGKTGGTQKDAPNGANLNKTGLAKRSHCLPGGDLEKSFSDTPSKEAPSKEFARLQLVRAIGEQNKGWEIVMAAEDPENPNHETAAKAVERIAAANRIGWTKPKRKPNHV